MPTPPLAAWPASPASWAAAGAGVVPGRVVAEHRGAWEVETPDGERRLARLPGATRHEADDRRDLPVVGDVVSLAVDPAGDAHLVQLVWRRRTLLLRRAAGRAAIPQPIAANVDRVLVVTSVGPELRPARLERYLAGAAESGAEARIVVTKADRRDRPGGLSSAALAEALAPFRDRAPILETSVVEGVGLAELRAWCAGVTSVLVGSSGVGKSTLLNHLLGEARSPTAPTRRRDDEGRHTTRRRELWELPSGGAIIDTPGMREFGVWIDGGGEDDGPRRGR